MYTAKPACGEHTSFWLLTLASKYIIRSQSAHAPRLKSRLYCFNCFVVLLSYLGIIVLNFVFRIANFKKDGSCVIGMEVKSLIPLIIFDAFLNDFILTKATQAPRFGHLPYGLSLVVLEF